ncbi:TetR/AcrR family transcriptional regulator [Lapidilactobacillus bayanensis]|uniref:TetR/AcrR family transcriptional regulator n=1 Tax=Lapidilactobacillus bayanensis TaxID=2485998 RepID=UPI000F7709FE|nr:TetR/AcrR family transcriptional regulator C-terminal domain-containing protein [Lapidilactobacillus bayanensis]
MQKRQTSSKTNIKKAFVHLLQTKGLEALSVSDIARDAQINRGTFYMHYVDKYDLLAQIEDELIEQFTVLLLAPDNEAAVNNPRQIIPYHAILNALYYAKVNYDLLNALLMGNDPKFITRFKALLEQLIEQQIKNSKKLRLARQGLPEDYATEILLSSIIGIITLWLHKGAIESPETIANIISKAKQISPYELLM